jgi:hypothetical protein
VERIQTALVESLLPAVSIYARANGCSRFRPS